MSAHSPSAQLAACLDRLGWGRSAALAAKIGIDGRQLANAITGRPVATIPFLRLCIAAHHDPLPALPHLFPLEPRDFDPVFFAMAVKIGRGLKGHSVREAGKAMDISGFTVSRIENAHAVSVGVVLRACSYIGVHIFGYLRPPCFTCVGHSNSLSPQRDQVHAST